MLGFFEWLNVSNSMKNPGYVTNISTDAFKNKNFRHVVYTSYYSQLVLMSLKPKEDIGMETHGVDQFFRVESGDGIVVLDGKKHRITDGSAVVVPAGVKHNVINTSATKPLQLYTIYSPPHHKDGVKVATKAKVKPEEFDGKVSFT
jgi:mannose-6-phosphate isomerase-like protein (cupin superfamily)